MPLPAWIRVTAAVSVLAIASVAVLGCSATDEDSADRPNTDLGDETASSAPDPCSLLTVDQIDSATGWALPDGERPEPTLEGDRTVCNWEDLRIGGIVQVQLDQGSGKAGFDHDTSELEKNELATPETVQINGSTDAVELADSGILTMLVGDDVVQLAVVGTGLDGTEQRALAADIAEALR